MVVREPQSGPHADVCERVGRIYNIDTEIVNFHFHFFGFMELHNLTVLVLGSAFTSPACLARSLHAQKLGRFFFVQKSDANFSLVLTLTHTWLRDI